MKQAYIPKDLDLQGRREIPPPEDDDLSCASGIVTCVIVTLALWVCAAAFWLAM
jgi:hypothetical protein